MMSIPMQRVYNVALEIDKKLTAYDFQPDKAVNILHDDGSRYWFENAFMLHYYDKENKGTFSGEHPNEWLLVFTEHHGFHVFSLDDLHSWSSWEEKKIEKHPDFPLPEWECESCGHDIIVPILSEEGQQACPICNETNLAKKVK